LRKEPLSFGYHAAACAGLIAAVYLKIYWGAFFINPFPLITPVQLLGYAVNILTGITITSTLSFVVGRLWGQAKSQPDGLVRYEQEKARHACISATLAPFHGFCQCLLSRKAGWSALLFSSVFLVFLITKIFLSEGGPPQLHVVLASKVVFSLSLFVLLATIRVFGVASMLSTERLPLLFVIAFIAFSGQLAISRAELVWKGGNKVIAVIAPAKEAEYGYIGELGSRTYLLEESSDGRRAMRVISVASSRVESLKSSFWKPFPLPQRRWWMGEEFQYGP
jgi:hypothetical protein